MRYVVSKYKMQQQEMAYRIYLSDSLFHLGRMESLNVRYYDMIHPKPVDKRSGDQIALEVINKAGLRFD